MKSFREFNQVSVEKYSQLSEHYDGLVEEGVLTENPLLRGAARFIPGLQQGYGIYRGTKALMKGDLAGAGLGYGSALPGPLGYGFAAADIARDMGFDPLNTKPGSKPQPQPQTQQQQPKSGSGMSAAELKAAQDQVNKLRQQGRMSNLPANYKQTELDAGAAAERFRPGAGLPRSGGGNQSTPKPPVLAVKGGQMGTFDRSSGKFTPRGFTDAETKRFQAAGGKLPPPKSTPLATRAATAKMPSFKSAMNMPRLSTGTQTQSRLDKALSGIKPGAGVPGSQQGAQRVQKQIQKLKTSL